jgi:hypothetical protein
MTNPVPDPAPDPVADPVPDGVADPVPGSDETPWEPPIAGTEVEHLLGALDRLRWTFRWKADGLDDEGLRTRIESSSLTLGRLLKHLALVEDFKFHVRLSGDPLPDVWAGADFEDDDWEFTSADQDPADQLYALWDGAVARSRERVAAALREGGLDRPIHVTAHGQTASLRRLLFDLVEEYGRHTGHADLLREAVDGRVGEDPPAGWHPE